MVSKKVLGPIIGGLLLGGAIGLTATSGADSAQDRPQPVVVRAGAGGESDAEATSTEGGSHELATVNVGDVIIKTKKVDGKCQYPPGGVQVDLQLPPGTEGAATVAMNDACEVTVTRITTGKDVSPDEPSPGPAQPGTLGGNNVEVQGFRE